MSAKRMGENDIGQADESGGQPLLAILNATDAIVYIARSNQGVGVRELARELRLTRGTALRVLQSLNVGGLLRRDDSGRYYIGPKFLAIASEHRRCLSLNETARRHMVTLSQTLRETVFLGVLETNKVVIVDRVDGPQALRMTADLGVRESAYATALGKIMLAALPRHEREAIIDNNPIEPMASKLTPSRSEVLARIEEAGDRGWALDNGEQVEGVRCVAAAILDQDRQVIAAVSASAPAFRMRDEVLEDVARHVMAAAAAISRELGYVPVAVGLPWRRL